MPQTVSGPGPDAIGGRRADTEPTVVILEMTETVDVILKDGGTLRLRPPAAEDTEALVAFFGGLSDRSLYLRFHGARRVDEKLVEPFLDPDWSTLGALVGTLGERIVALASYSRLRDPGTAEIAFAVADEEQGRGIATRLLEQLALRAADVGITGFVAEVMAENRAMLGVFADAGFELARELEHGQGELPFPIGATAGFRLPRRAADRAA